MATYQKHQVFVDDLADGVHTLASEQLVVALTTNANAPVVGDAILSDLTEIAYTNLSTRNITTTSSTQTSGTYSLILVDTVLTASGAVATFRWVDIYNDTPASPLNPLICFFDYGSDVTLASGETFTIDYATANTLFTLT